jgi:hypothetical protein
MPRYLVQQRYHSFADGQQWGPWEPGQEIELDADRAEWVERDSTGTLKPVAAIKPKPPAADRQHRGGANR